MRIRAILIGAGLTLDPIAALAQAPLSAIDWLSNSIAMPAALPGTDRPEEAAISSGAGVEAITVTPLDAVSPDAVGLLPASVTGLPRNLWGTSSSDELADLFQSIETGLLPAMQDLLFTLLLAELDPPVDSDASGRLFLARIDALLALGAVEQAQALLERAGPDDPERFRRWFDASLLTGTEDIACQRLRNAPGLAPTLPTQIFCLARGGDWNAAALTLETGRALGQMTGAEDALLTRFLDTEMFEGAPPLPPPTRPSPLMVRLYEAIGEALPTNTLPLAFAQIDLHANTGWKAQIEAAERLAASGGIPENQLFGLYTENKPAASGGVWGRVAAVQKFDAALASGRTDAVGASLPAAWAVMQRLELEAVFAKFYAKQMSSLPLSGDQAALAFRIGLLSEDYETIAAEHAPVNAAERFLKAIARGDLAGVVPDSEMASAVADGFHATGAPPALQRLIDANNLGAAILRAIALMTEATHGDVARLSDAIALFRAVGLEDVARRAALQVLVLDRRR